MAELIQISGSAMLIGEIIDTDFDISIDDANWRAARQRMGLGNLDSFELDMPPFSAKSLSAVNLDFPGFNRAYRNTAQDSIRAVSVIPVSYTHLTLPTKA